MTSTPTDIAEELKIAVLDCLGFIRTVFYEPSEQEDLLFVDTIISPMHPEMVMLNIVENMLPFSKMISKRKLEYFAKSKSIFSALPEDRVGHYRDKIVGGEVDEDDMEELWDHLDTISAYAEVYKKMV